MSKLIVSADKPQCTVCAKNITDIHQMIMIKTKMDGDLSEKTYNFGVCSEKCRIIALNNEQTKCFICKGQSKFKCSMMNTVKLGELYSMQFSFPGCSIECAQKLEKIMGKEIEPYLPKDIEKVKTHKCKYCGKHGKNNKDDKETLKKCSACKMVWYCDKICQKRDWPTHRLICK